jgi:hypothetical protein
MQDIQPKVTRPEEPKQHFISDEKFQQLKQCQQEIFTETDVSPSVRRIINELITVNNLEKIKKQFIAMIKNAI